jgi:hypothetical protein
MLRRVALVRTDVSEEPSASFISVTRIGELAITSNPHTLCACVSCWLQLVRFLQNVSFYKSHTA